MRRLFEDLARPTPGAAALVVAGECSPTLDVLETEHAVEIVLDVPGITADGLRILIKDGVVLIVGEKERTEPSRTPTSFHLVERDFGRFARAVRIHAAVDARKGAGDARQRRTAGRRCRRSPNAAAHDASLRSPSRRRARMKLLFIGDIVGRPGRDLVKRGARPLAREHAGRSGDRQRRERRGGRRHHARQRREIFKAGVDVITGGNHVWDKREMLEFIDSEPRLIRPANYPDGTPGAALVASRPATAAASA